MVPSPSAARAAELTHDAVVQVALTLADTDGLDTLTIRRLANHFGVTPMALYWHVKNKDELLDAMGDAVYAALVLPPADDRDWTEQYSDLLEALLDALRAHPGAVDLAGRRVLYNEPGRDLTERALALLRQAGLSVQASADIARNSLQTMMMLVSGEPGAERGAPADQRPDVLAAKKTALETLPAERYPRLVECATALVHCDDAAVYYREGLALFVAGVRAQVGHGAPARV
jgi:TetR/AcrR family tetracycline transcriptional repressor